MTSPSSRHSAEMSLQDSELTRNNFDDTLNIFEEKLLGYPITKIDTTHFENETETKDVDDLSMAERIIRMIVTGERENGSSSTPAPVTSYRTKNGPREVELKPQINDYMADKGVNFRLKLYCVEKKQDNSLSRFFSRMAVDPSRELVGAEQTSKSYILIYYRNIKRTKKEATSISPEIFALTTGHSWRVISKYADTNFSKLVEKRTLQFPVQYVKIKRQNGPVLTEAISARPGHRIVFSYLDYLDKIIVTRVREIRANSSLYSKSINAFLTQTGKHIPSQFRISENSISISHKMNIVQLGNVLDHFSKICLKEKTYLVKGEGGDRNTIEEDDNQMIEKHDFMVHVKDENFRQKLDEYLHQALRDSMEKQDSNIFLSHKLIDDLWWVDEISLHVRLPAKQMPGTSVEVDRKRTFCQKKIWYGIPSLHEVMVTLKEHYGQAFKEEWLEDVFIKFGSIAAPLKECIFSRFSAADNGTYIYYHGVWLEIKAQYLYFLETEFMETINSYLIQASKLPYLLPWTHQPGKTSYVNNTDPEWKQRLEAVCGVSFKQYESTSVLMEHSVTLDSTDLTEMSSQDKADNLYRLIRKCELYESHYNAAHTLLNMILPCHSKTRIITCDKKMPHGIELCDILIFDDKTTYLVHVKAGFDGGPIREVCSQIRNAADNIYHEQTISKGTGIIDKYWEILTKDAIDPTTHQNTVKRCLEHMTQSKFKELFQSRREVVFVLACRDTRKDTDFSKDIPPSNDARDAISKVISEQYSSAIIEKLIKEKYLTDQGALTDKFILEGKARKLDRKTFLNTIKCWNVIGSMENAKIVHEALLSVLPSSESTIAKMEIIRLVRDFQRYDVDKEKFHLKIYSICKE